MTDTREQRIGRKLNEDERGLLTHLSRWGVDGYPVRKLGKRWTWDFRSLKSPTLYRTQREAIEAFERFHDVLIEASGEEAYARAVSAAFGLTS